MPSWSQRRDSDLPFGLGRALGFAFLNPGLLVTGVAITRRHTLLGIVVSAMPCPEFIIALFSHLSVPSSFHLLHTYIICSSHSFRILQRNGTNRIYVEKEVLRAGECEICMIGCRPREELTLQS